LLALVPESGVATRKDWHQMFRYLTSNGSLIASVSSLSARGNAKRVAYSPTLEPDLNGNAPSAH
jgi:hypothetical protein